MGWEVVAVLEVQAQGAAQGLFRAHALLLVCSLLYLAWWATFFRPGSARVAGPLFAIGVLCLVGAAVCGVSGAVLAGSSLPGLPGAEKVPRLGFAVAGVVGYLALLVVTAGLFHRQVTTELLLIAAWGALEACVVVSLRAAGLLSGVGFLVFALLVVTLVVASLVCYVLYYRLGPVASFVDGMVPLLAVALESAAVMLATR